MDEGPANCTGLRGGLNDGMFAKVSTEQIEGPGGGTGNGINDGAALDKGLGIRNGDVLELAEEPAFGTGDASRSDEGPAKCAGLHDESSDGMFA